MVEAARKYDRIVQTGTQCRSHKGIQDAIAFLRSGKLGQIYMAKGLCYKPRGSIGHKPDGARPDGLDYDLWTGPAEMKPFNPNRLHYNWHWIWNNGNGDLGNQGIHQMDLARWGLGKTEFPKTVMPRGGRFGYKDDGETPEHPVRRLRVRRLRCSSSRSAACRPTTSWRSRSATSSTGPRASSPSPATPTGRPTSARSWRRAPAATAAATTSPTSSRPSKPRPQVAQRPTSRKATSPAPTATSATSPTGSAASSTSTPRPSRSSTTPEADAMLTREYRRAVHRAGEGLIAVTAA